MVKTYKRHKISDEDFIQAVKDSFSIRETMMKLGLNAVGNAYYVFHRRIKTLNLDTSHFCGQRWSKGKKFPSKRPIEDYFNGKASISSHTLRLRLLKEKIFPHQCMNCKNMDWIGNPIPLELEHINGNHEDNSLINLCLLCPNCHSLTPTHAGKNKALRNIKPLQTEGILDLSMLPPKKDPNWRTRPKLSQRKVERPPIEQILKEVEELGFSAVGRKYGVSDNAIRKWIKIHRDTGT